MLQPGAPEPQRPSLKQEPPMKTPRTLLSAPLLALCALHPSFAQSATPNQQPALLAFTTQPTLLPNPSYSSSRGEDPEAPNASITPATPFTGRTLTSYPGAAPSGDVSYRPFLSYAVAFRVGTGGLGGDIATPLLHRLALRAGGEAFSYSTTISTNGFNANGTIKLGETFAALDLHPFGGGFRISPGVAFHNRNNVNSLLNVPAGATITLNDVDYTSEPSDPIHGTAAATFSNKVAPRPTIGWGNSFPRNGGHWSFPVELGVYFTSKPKVAIALTGSACSSEGCGSINTPENQSNITAEEVTLTNDLAPARFFPVATFGVAYRFGH